MVEQSLQSLQTKTNSRRKKRKECIADLPVRVLACFNREPFFAPASTGKDPQKIAKSIKIIWSKVKHNCKASTQDKR